MLASSGSSTSPTVFPQQAAACYDFIPVINSIINKENYSNKIFYTKEKITIKKFLCFQTKLTSGM